MSAPLTEHPHLWEIEHPYYATEGNFYHSGCHSSYGTWADFIEDAKDWDADMNYLYRWDWNENELSLYFILQRKASCFSVVVSVTPSDERVIHDWLTIRWGKLVETWAGIS